MNESSPAKKHRTREQHTTQPNGQAAQAAAAAAASSFATAAAASGPGLSPAVSLLPAVDAFAVRPPPLIASRKRRAPIADSAATAASSGSAIVSGASQGHTGATRHQGDSTDDDDDDDDDDAEPPDHGAEDDAAAAAAAADPDEESRGVELDDGDPAQGHPAGFGGTATRALEPRDLDPASVLAVPLRRGLRSDPVTPLDHAWFFEKDTLTAAEAATHTSDKQAAAAPPLSTFLTAAQTALGLRSLSEVPQSMTRAQWNALRRSIGRTRRLSAACLRAESIDLQKQRVVWRRIQASHTPLTAVEAIDPTPVAPPAAQMPIYPSASWLSMEKAQQRAAVAVAAAALAAPPAVASEAQADYCPSVLVDGTPVLVRHPSDLGSFAYATILSHAFHRVPLGFGSPPFVSVMYRVGFEGQAAARPTTLDDTEVFCIPPHLREDAAQSSRRFMDERRAHTQAAKQFSLAPPPPPLSSAPVSDPPLFLEAADDVTLVCQLLQLVDRKRILLDQLQEMNDTMEILRQTSADQSAPQQAEGADQQMAHADAGASQQLTQPASMDIDSDIPSLEAPIMSDAAAQSAAAATLPPAAAPAAASACCPPLSLSPADFSLSFDLFRRQYAWLVLHLESTSSSLDATHMQLRVRRATRRRMLQTDGSAYLSSSSSSSRPSSPSAFLLHSRDYGNAAVASALSLSDDGSLSALRAEAEDDFVAPMLVQLRPPLPLRGRGALLAQKGSAVHTLVSQAVAAVLLVERGFAGADVRWLSLHTERLLHALAPQHSEHQTLHAQVADAMHQLQDMMRACKAGATAHTAAAAAEADSA